MKLQFPPLKIKFLYISAKLLSYPVFKTINTTYLSKLWNATFLIPASSSGVSKEAFLIAPI